MSRQPTADETRWINKASKLLDLFGVSGQVTWGRVDIDQRVEERRWRDLTDVLGDAWFGDCNLVVRAPQRLRVMPASFTLQEADGE